MSNDIKFSVTVPAFKAKFLKECIDSILAQTYKNFEVIIVNDASPQDLDSIVNQYDDERIRYYKNEKGFGAYNVVGNWNKCLKYATGDYLICMGDDDKLLPNCLQDYYDLIVKYPDLNVYHSMTEIIDENSEVSSMQDNRSERESMLAFIWGKIIKRTYYIGDWLFKTSRLRENGGFYSLPYAWSSDLLSVIIAAREGGIANTQVPGFQYRISSLTISRSDKNVPGKLLATEQTYQKILKIVKAQKCEGLDKVYKQLILNKLSEKYDQEKSDYMSHYLSPFLLLTEKKKKKYKISKKTVLRALYYKACNLVRHSSRSI